MLLAIGKWILYLIGGIAALVLLVCLINFIQYLNYRKSNQFKYEQALMKNLRVVVDTDCTYQKIFKYFLDKDLYYIVHMTKDYMEEPFDYDIKIISGYDTYRIKEWLRKRSYQELGNIKKRKAKAKEARKKQDEKDFDATMLDEYQKIMKIKREAKMQEAFEDMQEIKTLINRINELRQKYMKEFKKVFNFK